MDKKDRNKETREMLDKFKEIIEHLHAKLQIIDAVEEVAVDVAGDNSSIVIQPENSKKKRIKIKHYSNKQKILLVGEGDFSFAVCLAKAFGNAENMVATSRDSKEDLLKHYPMAGQNLEELEKRGCTVVHCVDAHIMTRHRSLSSERFDRIVFNFPHAGFQNKEDSVKQIKTHKKLVKGFFRSAKEMVTDMGEIHVTHKNAYPFSEWDLEGLAEEVGLKLRKKVWFSLSDYQGYTNKKGSGKSWNKTFPVGASFTFKFVLSNSGKK